MARHRRLIVYLVACLIAIGGTLRYLEYWQSHPSRWAILSLLAVLYAGLAVFPWVSRRSRPVVHLYLALQTCLLGALTLVTTIEDVAALPLMSLILLAMPAFPPKIGYRWVGLFTVLIVGSMIVFGIVDPGLDVGWLVLNALLYVVIYFFLSTFMVVIGQLEVARDQAQEARAHSESLLAELQVAHEQLHLYTAQAEELAVTAERNRLARELHDSVTQSLHSAALMAEAGQRLAGTGDLERTQHYLSRLGDISQQALKEMRLMVYELRPLALRQVGLVGALQQRLDAVERRAGVDARLVVVGPSLDGSDAAESQEVELPVEAEEALYRIAQEALNNALKHGQPSTVTVTLRMEGWVELAVADDGAGFDVNAALGSAGIGLSSMRERAEKLGGTLTIHSAPGQGTTIKVTLQDI